jgi:hypothetical protein
MCYYNRFLLTSEYEVLKILEAETEAKQSINHFAIKMTPSERLTTKRRERERDHLYKTTKR